jgi:hypothetical protein
MKMVLFFLFLFLKNLFSFFFFSCFPLRSHHQTLVPSPLDLPGRRQWQWGQHAVPLIREQPDKGLRGHGSMTDDVVDDDDADDVVVGCCCCCCCCCCC